MIALNNFLPKQIGENELLLRAVRPWPRFWKDGRLSSAALKDSQGLSVDRTYDRSLETAIAYMQQHLSGDIVTFTLDACRSVGAVVLYRPTTNIFHCEIHGGSDSVVLSPLQAKELAECANIVYCATITTT